jgi:hypothetical protein
VPIHSSNVMVISLNLDDDYRSRKVQGAPKVESSPSEKKVIGDKEKEDKKE